MTNTLMAKQLNKATFSDRVVTAALSIPKGKVTTYGRIARAAGGGAMASQSITSILGKAWENGEKKIPFHRIVYADGKVWIDERHKKERLALYKKERIEIEKGRVKNFRDLLYEF
jgi:methylated-DNA-protein-cysteine methyltransferase related protein